MNVYDLLLLVVHAVDLAIHDPHDGAREHAGTDHLAVGVKVATSPMGATHRAGTVVPPPRCSWRNGPSRQPTMVDPAGGLPQVTDAPSSKPVKIVDPVATSRPTGGTRVAITNIDVAGIGKNVVTGSKRIGGRRLAPSSARTAGDPAAAADRMPGRAPGQLSPQRCARLHGRPNDLG